MEPFRNSVGDVGAVRDYRSPRLLAGVGVASTSITGPPGLAPAIAKEKVWFGHESPSSSGGRTIDSRAFVDHGFQHLVPASEQVLSYNAMPYEAAAVSVEPQQQFIAIDPRMLYFQEGHNGPFRPLLRRPAGCEEAETWYGANREDERTIATTERSATQSSSLWHRRRPQGQVEHADGCSAARIPAIEAQTDSFDAVAVSRATVVDQRKSRIENQGPFEQDMQRIIRESLSSWRRARERAFLLAVERDMIISLKTKNMRGFRVPGKWTKYNRMLCHRLAEWHGFVCEVEIPKDAESQFHRELGLNMLKQPGSKCREPTVFTLATQICGGSYFTQLGGAKSRGGLWGSPLWLHGDPGSTFAAPVAGDRESCAAPIPQDHAAVEKQHHGRNSRGGLGWREINSSVDYGKVGKNASVTTCSNYSKKASYGSSFHQQSQFQIQRRKTRGHGLPVHSVSSGNTTACSSDDQEGDGEVTPTHPDDNEVPDNWHSGRAAAGHQKKQVELHRQLHVGDLGKMRSRNRHQAASYLPARQPTQTKKTTTTEQAEQSPTAERGQTASSSSYRERRVQAEVAVVDRAATPATSTDVVRSTTGMRDIEVSWGSSSFYAQTILRLLFLLAGLCSFAMAFPCFCYRW
ncbi:unnamed protein product [Amoebophrya sp. A120]|nr:unnamed protein product [Amoebophrya sp. A120]|eukprot:GSA120T00021634001.1